jgi:hypothetical protein
MEPARRCPTGPGGRLGSSPAADPAHYTPAEPISETRIEGSFMDIYIYRKAPHSLGSAPTPPKPPGHGRLIAFSNAPVIKPERGQCTAKGDVGCGFGNTGSGYRVAGNRKPEV